MIYTLFRLLLVALVIGGGVVIFFGTLLVVGLTGHDFFRIPSYIAVIAWFVMIWRDHRTIAES